MQDGWFFLLRCRRRLSLGLLRFFLQKIDNTKADGGNRTHDLLITSELLYL